MMFFFSFEAKPRDDHPEAMQVGGAYIDCWLRGRDERQAEGAAREFIASRGWQITSTEDEGTVERSDYADDPEMLAYFCEAEEKGACYVFEAWLLESEEGSADEASMPRGLGEPE